MLNKFLVDKSTYVVPRVEFKLGNPGVKCPGPGTFNLYAS